MFDLNFIKDICYNYKFNIDNYIGCKAISKGHINTTYTLYFDHNNIVKRYLLQQINTDVFIFPYKVMNNIEIVTQHIKKNYKKRMDYKRKVLRIVKTKDRLNYFKTNDGKIYRIYHYIENATTYDTCSNKKIFNEAGRTIGEFLNHLSTLKPNCLYESIKDFHNTPKRYSDFLKAMELCDDDKKSVCKKEIMFLVDNCDIAFDMQRKIDDKIIPKRITHNDTKLNNIMFEYGTNKGLCLVDLDTVMEGCLCFDYGDFIRSACNLQKEDVEDASTIVFQKDLCIEFTKGFLAKMKDISLQEVKNLINGALTMTYECGMRFLTDYLLGNKYFKVDYESQNLARCRTQIEMCKQIIYSKKELEEKIIELYMKKDY